MTPQDKGLVIVTGASGGLGQAIAQAIGSNGYRVVGISRGQRTAADVGLPDDVYRHVAFDLSDTDGIAALVSEIVRDSGAPYALINNAAVGADGSLPTMHNRDIERCLRLNLTSPIILTKYAARHMLARRRGRIVNVSSIVAQTGFRGLSVYGASKGGLEGFTRSCARDLGSRGITVNSVAPGFMETDMTASLGEDLERFRRRAALGRFATVEEVAGSVVYLLSDAAAAVTGTTITVDAGSTA